ncbi:MAG TPA: glycine zipper 2TM domain-containing protein [Casimicrobiaceae bacterium]|nr:glycine zipper 2TM domain-containing protein [Casimicrobiaceae bacterium]
MLVVALTAALLLSACAPMPPYGYPAYQAYRPQSVELGVVETARGVRMQGPDTGVGTVAGAALGGLAGSGIGSGGGNAAAIIGGAILGGIAGNAVERDASKFNGVEVTVRLDSGRMIAVVQPDAGEFFRPGDRVRVVSDGYAARVSR